MFEWMQSTPSAQSSSLDTFTRRGAEPPSLSDDAFRPADHWARPHSRSATGSTFDANVLQSRVGQGAVSFGPVPSHNFRERARHSSSMDNFSKAGFPQHLRGFYLVKFAVFVTSFHFGIQLLINFSEMLLPFIFAVVLTIILEPLKRFIARILQRIVVMVAFKLNLHCCLETKPYAQVPRNLSDEGFADTPGYGEAYTGTGDDSVLEESPSSTGVRPVPVPAVKRTILAISIMLCLLFTGRVLSLVAQSFVVGCYSLAADVDQYKAGIKRIEKWVRAYIRDMHMESFDWNSMLDEAVSFVQVWFSSLTSNVLFSFVQGTVMLIFLLYMLWSPVKMESNTVTREVFKTTGRYLMVKCLISAFTGILIAILLWCCDLQLPGTFGLFAFLAKFLPGIGSVIAPTLPCILAIVDVRKTPTQVLVAFVLQSFAHFCIDCFVEPMFFGMSMQIHSVIVVLGIWFFFSVWGIAGALLSVPILAVARLLLKSMKDADQGDANDTIAFFDNILEGRWMSSVGDNHQNAEQEMELPEFSILQGDSKDLSQDIQLAKTASQPPIKDFWEILNQTDAGRLLRDFYASNQFCIDLILLIGLMAALVFAP